MPLAPRWYQHWSLPVVVLAVCALLIAGFYGGAQYGRAAAQVDAGADQVAACIRNATDAAPCDLDAR